MYSDNKRVSKYMKQKWTKLKTDKLQLQLNIFKLLSVMDKTSRKKNQQVYRIAEQHCQLTGSN